MSEKPTSAFLTPSDHAAFCRWDVPRRNVRGKIEKGGACFVCGKPAPKCEGHVSHRVPYRLGIKKYGLTPAWLNRPENLVWAHITCNGHAEIPDAEISDHLVQHGLELPSYIKERIAPTI